MRKILLMRLFYLKKLDFKQLLQTYENHIIPSPVYFRCTAGTATLRMPGSAFKMPG